MKSNINSVHSFGIFWICLCGYLCVWANLCSKEFCVCVCVISVASFPKEQGAQWAKFLVGSFMFLQVFSPNLDYKRAGFFAFKRLVCYGKPDPVNECQLDALQRTLNGFLFMTFQVGVVFLLFDSFDVFCIYSGVRSTRTMSQNWIDDQGYRIRHEAVVSNRTRVEVGHM